MWLHFYLYDNSAYVFRWFRFSSPVTRNLNQIRESSAALKVDPCTSATWLTRLHEPGLDPHQHRFKFLNRSCRRWRALRIISSSSWPCFRKLACLHCTWSLSKCCQAQRLKKEIPQCSGLTQCVFYSRSQEIGYFLSRLLGAEGGLSHRWDGNLYEYLPPGLKEYKVPWMLSNKKQRMPNKSPVHFSLLQLESYFTFSLWLLWIPPAAGCAALENTPTPCISRLLIN